ncbi:putative amidohydrolase 3 [Burkholderia multivorans]
MCIACHWGKYFDFAERDSDETTGELNSSGRRRALQALAALATTGVASLMDATPANAQTSSRDHSGHADLVFLNGAVYTVSGPQRWARAVAVHGKQIAYVGDDNGARAHIGPATRVVDLKGRMLIPGFVESHIHPFGGSAITQGIDLQIDSREQVLKVLDAHRAEIGNVTVVRGYGWRYNAFPGTGPRREDLDRIWPDTPVFLIAIDGHCAWVNTKALKLAGITRDTKDPVPDFSYFMRDEKTGEPTGYLVEVPAMLQVLNKVAPFDSSYIADALGKWLPQASAAGITTLFDAGVQIMPDEEAYALYTTLEKSGKLPFRVVGSTYHNNPAVDPLPIIRSLRRRFNSELVQVPVLKLNIDGGDAQYTAALLEPYADKPGTSGDTLLPPAMIADLVRRADREGIDVHCHSYGDRATRLTLDAIEAAVKVNPPRTRRHTLAHLILVDDKDVPRFGELGVVAQFSSQWAVPDASWKGVMVKRYGDARANRLYRMASIQKHGGPISLGTDWPAAGYYSTFRPLEAIEIATTRRELGKAEQSPLEPADEKMSLDDALRASTLGGAWQLRMEHRIGSIEVGKLADLVVLDKNLFEIPSHEIHKAKVVMTVMNGKIRHGMA